MNERIDLQASDGSDVVGRQVQFSQFVVGANEREASQAVGGQVQKLELGHALHLGRVDDLQDIARQVQSLQGSGEEERCLEKTTVGAIR